LSVNNAVLVRMVLEGRSVCVGGGWRHLHLQAVGRELFEATDLLAAGTAAFLADQLPQLAG
jgi:hypothetical protein